MSAASELDAVSEKTVPPKCALQRLAMQLEDYAGSLNEAVIRRLLTQANLSAADVAPYVKVKQATYNRHCIHRSDAFELLVLTWAPNQASVAHDHAGSICGLKVIHGQLTEKLFTQGPDGQVREMSATSLQPGEITVDPGTHGDSAVIHSLGNASSTDMLVTVHIYAPALSEMRRYAVTGEPPAAVFTRSPKPGTPTVAIIGGGFTGCMALANLLRFGSEQSSPLHIVMIDRQAAIGEGVAYRTNDMKHLLNVPAAKMSAWPDKPDDFLEFCKSKNPVITGGDFMPRRTYGQYVRHTLNACTSSAAPHLSAEIIRDDAASLQPIGSSAANGWRIETTAGRTIDADLAIVTVGHRPPDDVCAKKWLGSQKRLVSNPWATLTLTQIRGDEPVLLLGSGLTAVDALLTLGTAERTAPIHVVSRRGLLPQPHLRNPKPPLDMSALLKDWLDPTKPLETRHMVRSLRQAVEQASTQGHDWRQVIDGLRAAIPALWDRLDITQRSRFLTHVRPFWEIHRHRMAPDVADTIAGLQKSGVVQLSAGTFHSAIADDDAVNIALTTRRSPVKRVRRVAWVVNCTGPGVQGRHSTHPILRPLLEAGILCDDEFSLGLRTDPTGRALTCDGAVLNSLLVAGTLRKSTLWESTAVPELRGQSQTTAQAALKYLAAKGATVR